VASLRTGRSKDVLQRQENAGRREWERRRLEQGAAAAASGDLAAHVAAADPHPQYLLEVNFGAEFDAYAVAGTGISVVGGTITNTAPDQVVGVTAGAGISIGGSYPNFTVTNTAPDQTVVLTDGTNITITGTYPNFTINSSAGGSGDVTAAASMDDNAVIRGDGGVKGVQESGWFVDDNAILFTNHTAALTYAASRIPRVQVNSTGSTDPGIGVASFSTTAARGARIQGARSKNASVGSHTAVADDDALLSVSAEGSDGSAFFNAGSVVFAADGTPSAGIVSGKVQIQTRDTAGNNNTVVDIRADQSVSISGRLKLNAATNMMEFDADAASSGLHTMETLTADRTWTWPDKTGTVALRTPNKQTVTSAATVTPTFGDDIVEVTAQAAALALANPTGTAIEGLGIVIRIKDNGTARAITWDTQYRAVGVTLPVTTVLSKWLYIGMIYNGNDTKWDVTAVAQQA
jgi:hypothetical protein